MPPDKRCYFISFYYFSMKKKPLNIRIHHECEGGIEKSVPRITDWHQVKR